MAKETCSVRLDTTLKSDLDKLLNFNGQTLGHMVNVEMSFMLLELIDDFEHQMRDNRRQNRFNDISLEFLETAKPSTHPKLFPDGSKEPDFTDQFLEDLDLHTEFGFAFRAIYYRFEVPVNKEKLLQYRKKLEKEFEEIKAFLRVADSFENITREDCIDWVDESGFLKKEVRERIMKNNIRNENYEERLEKIQRRYWFPENKEMWNGTKPITSRFLNHLCWLIR